MLLHILELKTTTKNREIIENILLQQNAVTSSVVLNKNINSLEEKNFNTKAIFYSKPNLNKLKNILAKLDKRFKNIKLITIEYIQTYKTAKLKTKVIDRFNIMEYKKASGFNIHKDIIIPAAAGFGTGHHPTTEGIIKILNKTYFQKNLNVKSIIDIGCGSGILSIIAAKLFRCMTVAVDIDKLAVKAAKDNYKNNLVNNYIKIFESSFPCKSVKINYDIIIVNILVLPIMEMAKDIHKYINKNGRIIISGIFKNQVHMICNKFRTYGLILDKFYIIDNWIAISLKTYVPPKL